MLRSGLRWPGEGGHEQGAVEGDGDLGLGGVPHTNQDRNGEAGKRSRSLHKLRTWKIKWLIKSFRSYRRCVTRGWRKCKRDCNWYNEGCPKISWLYSTVIEQCWLFVLLANNICDMAIGWMVCEFSGRNHDHLAAVHLRRPVQVQRDQPWPTHWDVRPQLLSSGSDFYS